MRPLPLLATLLALALAPGCADPAPAGIPAAARAPAPATAPASPDDARALRLENARLRGKIKALEADVAAAESLVRELTTILGGDRGEPFIAIPEGRPQRVLPSVFGRVTRVEGPLVLVDAGLSSGLEKGMQLTVYRGNEFVAKLVVERSEEASAGARVLFTAPGKAVTAGDEVATRLD